LLRLLLSQLELAHRVTLGVNDVGYLFISTNLFVNPHNRFKAKHLKNVEQSNVKSIYRQIELGLAMPPAADSWIRIFSNRRNDSAH
jgi:hypothetical protein